MRFLSLLLAAASVLAIRPISAPAQNPAHPLDPMTWQEYWTVLEVLDEAGHLSDETVIPVVHLQNPHKNEVFAWIEGGPVQRRAFAILRQGPDAYEAVVDLVNPTLISYKHKEGVQAMWVDEDYDSMTDSLKANPEFAEALRKRGFESFRFIDCWVGPPGYFATEHQIGRRVARAECVDRRGVRNTWSRMISGLSAIIDMNTKEVLEVVDEGVVKMATVSADYDRESIGPAREVPGPMFITQPNGAGFTMDGHQVAWQNWSFHVRPDQRVGMILSLINYDDHGDVRSVVYQGNVSEIFVPYMDPAFEWYARNFLDAGEYSFGGLASPLIEGVDCPDHAVYVDQLVGDDAGRPVLKPRAICLFERETGDMAWRHVADETEGGAHGRKKRDLVVRMGVVLGNYDYIFDWVFQQDGSIRVAVGATGIAESKTVNQETAAVAEAGASDGGGMHGSNGSNGSSGMDGSDESGLPAEAKAGSDDAYGRFVDRQIVAVNHDHYFNFRLDLDVDGSTNNLQLDRLVTKELPEGHPRRSVWVAEPTIAKTESDAKLRINLDRPTLWRVTSANRTNHVGYPTSYQLMPSKNVNTLLSADDYPRRRAGFIDHHLWATPYEPSEQYAAGDYPTLSQPGMGLPAYTASNRSIAETDIVLWYTVGMHHMVRAEDWPQMPVLWHSVEIRPFDFFDRNPAMDLPE